MNAPHDPRASAHTPTGPDGSRLPQSDDPPDGPVASRPSPGSAPRDADHTRHPVDPAEESATGEEDPGSALDVSIPAPRGP